MFVLSVGAAQASGRLGVELDAGAAAVAAVAAAMYMLGVGALIEPSQAGSGSELTDGAAGGGGGGAGLAAGRVGLVGLVGVVVIVVGAAAAVVVAGGGVEDLGLSEGDDALTSSTGLIVLFLRDRFFSAPFFLPAASL